MQTLSKSQAWDNLCKHFDRVVDGIGVCIDSGIMDVVVGLNAVGVNTEASCEGHLDHGHAYPWILISAPHTDDLEEELRQARLRIWQTPESEREQAFDTYQEIEQRLKPLHMQEWDKVIDLLDSFYKHHTVTYDSRLMVSDSLGSGSFFLQSQGATRQETRGTKERTPKLKEYQQEAQTFAAFLKRLFLGENDFDEAEYAVGQAADLLGIRHETLTRNILRGNLIAEKKGRDYFIKRSELERFKKNRRTVGRPKIAERSNLFLF